MTLAFAPADKSLASLESVIRTFTLFDWLIVVTALWSVVRGLMRGLIRELFALAGLFLGILVAAWYYPPVALWLSRWISQPAYAGIVAFLGITACATAAVILVGRLVRSTAHLVGLGLLDRLAGGLFGLLRACLLGAAILMAWTAFLPPQPILLDSRLAPALLGVAHTVSFLAPNDLRTRIVAELSRLHP